MARYPLQFEVSAKISIFLFQTELNIALYLFLGVEYNIPVCLWLLDTHPYNPPIVYVVPTNTMRIKQGRHVDSNGKVYLPYLHEWKHVRLRLTIYL